MFISNVSIINSGHDNKNYSIHSPNSKFSFTKTYYFFTLNPSITLSLVNIFFLINLIFIFIFMHGTEIKPICLTNYNWSMKYDKFISKLQEKLIL